MSQRLSSETNRLAQIIANAADKELGTRVLSGGQPRRQDKAAAQAIETEYLFIRRDEMPHTDIVFKDNAWHVDVGSEAGTWSCKSASADYARKTGLEYIAASIALQEHKDIEASLEEIKEAKKLRDRRNALALQYFDLRYEYLANVSDKAQTAIDHIIRLEREVTA